jgi:hypothetical protein
MTQVTKLKHGDGAKLEVVSEKFIPVGFCTSEIMQRSGSVNRVVTDVYSC